MWYPDGHLARTTVCPCVVGDEDELLVGSLELARLVEGEGLCVGGEGLNVGVHDFLVAECELDVEVVFHGVVIALLEDYSRR